MSSVIPTMESLIAEEDILFQTAINKIYEQVKKSVDGEIIKLPSCFKEHQLDIFCKFFKSVGLTWKLVDNG
jgi:hypothetical protein